MNEIENEIQHEVIKNILKQGIDNNPYLSPHDKQIQKSKIDMAANQADQIVHLLSMIKYL